ncbi:MAG TPA: PilZ domain-containing protein [Thermoanaerobaculia bacterium]|nr:PilZ domain-containing protein [Thermoanaerobaculia bacterium]
MPEPSVIRAEARRNGDSPSERRHCPRKPVPDVVVAVEMSDTDGTASPAVSDTGGGLAWAGSAIDISPEGLALTLPEDIPVGSEVLLTFRLDDETAFARVPSVVIRKQPGFGLGAVRFRGWSRSDRHALGAYLG